MCVLFHGNVRHKSITHFIKYFEGGGGKAVSVDHRMVDSCSLPICGLSVFKVGNMQRFKMAQFTGKPEEVQVWGSERQLKDEDD